MTTILQRPSPEAEAALPPHVASGRDARVVLDVRDLSVTYDTPAGPVHAVRDASLRLHAGETLGVVGESGCGKSTLSFAIMRHLGENGRITAGSIQLHGEEITTLSNAALRRHRGRTMAMVYQDPQTSLNPAIPVGEQLAEAFQVHAGPHGSRDRAQARALEMLDRVGLPDPVNLARRYPHQLSGGQQQRVVIAMALVNEPSLLLMDEPTTGLDVTTEARILDLVNHLKREFDAAILYISHNLGVIAQVCDRVAVMYAGEIVEQADVTTLFRAPRHPYTVGLLSCVPRPGSSKHDAALRPIPGRLPPRTQTLTACVFAPRCELAQDVCREVAPPLAPVPGLESATPAEQAQLARCHFSHVVPTWAEAREAAQPALVPADGATATGSQMEAPETSPVLSVQDLSRWYGGARASGPLGKLLTPLLPKRPVVHAVEQVSFDLAPGETLALVGESGCGKTTLARTIAGLLRPTAGRISFLGQDVAATVDARPASMRRDLQMVFQNPDASLNPRQTVGQIVRRPVELFLGLRGREARRRVNELLESVQLDPSYYDRLPRQLSGGEKQRVSIARAFAGDPRLVICDEAVSALDVSVQAAILNLLVSLQQSRGTSYLFISHDLGVVQYLADWIAVMYFGQIVDYGRTRDVIRGPHHAYTEKLLSAIPVPDPAKRIA